MIKWANPAPIPGFPELCLKLCLYWLIGSIYHIRSWLLLSVEGYDHISGVYGHVCIVTFCYGCELYSSVRVTIRSAIILVIVNVGRVASGKKDKPRSL